MAHALRAEGFDASEDGTGRGTPIVPVIEPICYDFFQITAPVNRQNRKPGDPCHTLARDNASYATIAFDCLAGGETGLSVGEVPGALHGGGKSGGRSAVAFDCKGTQVQHDDSGASPTLRAMGHADSHANAGGQLAVAFDVKGGLAPNGSPALSEAAFPLKASDHKDVQAVALPWAVRRLTPVECERLQGFPDDFTLVPVGNRMAADGPRYKALGNSMAVNAMEWLGERISMVEDMA